MRLQTALRSPSSSFQRPPPLSLPPQLTATRLNYFGSAWNLLDLVVVIEGIVSLALTGIIVSEGEGGGGGGGSVKVLRMLRVLRPLRTAKRVPQIRVIIEAMAKSVNTIWNVLVVYAVFLLVTSLIAVALWRGTLQELRSQVLQVYPTRRTNCTISVSRTIPAVLSKGYQEVSRRR